MAHVFVTAAAVDSLEFEVLKVNTGTLQNYIGTKQMLSCDADTPFWGELVSLDSCESTAPGLASMRERPTLKGVLRIFPSEHTERQ